MSWRFVVIVASVLAAAVLSASSAAESSPAPSCFPKGSKTLAATKTARVFSTRRGTYGCLYRYGRARRLDPWSNATDTQERAVKPFRFAGPYLAYPRWVSQGCGADVCDWTEVVVADLRPTKRFQVQAPYAMSDETLKAFEQGPTEAVFTEAFVTDLGLLKSGAVGWIECEGDTRGPCYTDASKKQKAQTSVFAARPGRSRKKLDEGSAIDKHSLTWANGLLRWQNDGQQRSAAFR